MLQQGGQTHRQCCDMLRSNVAIAWPELANAGQAMLRYVVMKCCDRLAGALQGLIHGRCCQRNSITTTFIYFSSSNQVKNFPMFNTIDRARKSENMLMISKMCCCYYFLLSWPPSQTTASVLARLIHWLLVATNQIIVCHCTSYPSLNQKLWKQGCDNWKNNFKTIPTQTVQRPLEDNFNLKHAKLRHVRQFFHKNVLGVTTVSSWRLNSYHHQTRNWVAICIRDLSPGINVLISEKLPLDISLVWAIRPRG